MREHAPDIDELLGKALIGGMLVAYLVVAGLAAVQALGGDLMDKCEAFVPLLVPFAIIACLAMRKPSMGRKVITALVGLQALIDAVWVMSGPHAGWPLTHVPMWAAVSVVVAFGCIRVWEAIEHHRQAIRL